VLGRFGELTQWLGEQSAHMINQFRKVCELIVGPGGVPTRKLYQRVDLAQ
jgi:hypothetical protein